MSQKGTTTQTNWSRGYLDGWADHPTYRRLRVRNDPEYQRGLRDANKDRDDLAWLLRPFSQQQSVRKSGWQKAAKESVST